MAEPTENQTIAHAVEQQLQKARLRILIVGAGIAGATLGALLRRRGEPAAIIERTGPNENAGYMLGMMPLGGRVLNGLGLTETYLKASLSVRDYVMHDRRGRLLRRYDLTKIIERFGNYRGIERGALIAIIRKAAGAIHFDSSVTAIHQGNNYATVTFNDGSKTDVNLVVIADGIHSRTRTLVFGETNTTTFDTGWGGFIGWTDLPPDEARTYREFWSTKWGIGMYPVPDRMGLFLAGRHDEIARMEPFAVADRLAAHCPPEPFAHALEALDRSSTPVYWKMADCHAKTWWSSRAVLLGDAAAAFLPTAGVGASAAMDSAAALSDELSRADNAHMGYALSLYEKRQRHRVEKAQNNSRFLARLMFINSRPYRNILARPANAFLQP